MSIYTESFYDYLWSMQSKIHSTESARAFAIIAITSLAFFVPIAIIAYYYHINPQWIEEYLFLLWAALWILMYNLVIRNWLWIRKALFKKTYKIIFIEGFLIDFILEFEKNTNSYKSATQISSSMSPTNVNKSNLSMKQVLERFIKTYIANCENANVNPYLTSNELSTRFKLLTYVLTYVGYLLTGAIIVSLIYWLGIGPGLVLSVIIIAVSVSVDYTFTIQGYMMEVVIRKVLVWELFGGQCVGEW